MSGGIQDAEKFKGMKRQIPGISFFNDFQFVKDGILVRKASGIGAGKLFPIKPIKQTAKFVGKIITSQTEVIINRSTPAEVCMPEKNKSKPLHPPTSGNTSEVPQMDGDIVLEEEEDKTMAIYRRSGNIYVCDYEMCQAKFITVHGLRAHKQ